MSWSITSSSVLARLKGTAHNKTKYIIHNSDTHKDYVVLHWPGIPCVVYDMALDNVVSKYSWWYSRPTGYMYAHTTDGAYTASTTMHSVIMRNLHGAPENASMSVDHINFVKTFNVSDNLRYATQGEQNTNRQNRKDKALPPKELQDIGITSLPRYIRYDKFENKFVIERKHPGLDKLTTPINCSGTKSTNVSVIYKYYDILKKLDFLNKINNTPERSAFIRIQNSLYKDYCEISLLITGNQINDNMNYDNTECEYNSIEKYLTDEELKYERRGLPENCEIDITDLPKYCCYQKAKCKHGDLFYISKLHPHLKAIGARGINTTSSKNVSLADKYNEMRDILELVDTNEGEELKRMLNNRSDKKKGKTAESDDTE